MLLGYIFTSFFRLVATFHLIHLIRNLVAMLLGYIFASFFRLVATFLPGRWNTTNFQLLLSSIITYGFSYRSTFLGINVFLNLLWLRPLLKLAHFLVLVMTILPFNWNRTHFSQLFTYFLFPVFTIIR